MTIVVCTRNRPVELERCLASLAQLEPQVQEIIVVNSAGDDSAVEIARRHSANYLYCTTAGLSRARNAGAAAARSDLVGFLDDDSIADPAWTVSLAAAFADPKVMVATGTIELFGGVIADYHFAILPVELQVDRHTPGWFWLANTGGIGLGGNMMFRREAFQQWTGFDVRLGRGAPIAGAEEHLAFFQLIESGYRCVHVPGAVVRHPGFTSEEHLASFELEMIETAAAYMTLLFVEYPAHRMELLRKFLRRLFRGKNKQVHPASSFSRKLSLWVRLRAALRGVRLYWKTRSR